jgi:hypothetical protein
MLKIGSFLFSTLLVAQLGLFTYNSNLQTKDYQKLENNFSSFLPDGDEQNINQSMDRKFDEIMDSNQKNLNTSQMQSLSLSSTPNSDFSEKYFTLSLPEGVNLSRPTSFLGTLI